MMAHFPSPRRLSRWAVGEDHPEDYRVTGRDQGHHIWSEFLYEIEDESEPKTARALALVGDIKYYKRRMSEMLGKEVEPLPADEQERLDQARAYLDTQRSRKALAWAFPCFV